jgi:hypothetical protein
MPQKKPSFDLVRGLGKWASIAIVVGTMIGTGIFLKPSEMARDAGSLGIVYTAWILGAILSLFGALAYAELGAAIPEAGGEWLPLWLDAFHRRSPSFNGFHRRGLCSLQRISNSRSRHPTSYFRLEL